jgi:peptide/nickel transport system substrate-binding protein
MRKAAIFILAVLAALAAGCGDEPRGREGGSITIGLSSQPDSLDPALAYTGEAWESLWLVYTPLLTYAHEEGTKGTKLIPGLAQSLPKVTDGGRTYTLSLRPGLTYSNGSRVRASDIEASVKRVLATQSGGTPFFMSIAGAEDFLKAGKPTADISGIDADDKTGKITIHLMGPDGTFANSLASTFGALVPGDTPPKDQTKKPPPGVGPYVIVKSDPEHEFVLRRRKGFSLPGIPKPKLDQITVRIIDEPRRETEQVIDNRLDYMVDPPAPDLLSAVRERDANRYTEHTTVSTYFFFLNSKIAPFDKREAREAANFAIDNRAVSRLFGGLLEPGCNFLPPGLPGHQTIEPCPWGDPNGPADLNRARKLIEKAGVKGEKVTVYGPAEPEPRRAISYFADQLNRIGLKATPKALDPSVYMGVVGSAKTKAQAGFANFFQDFPHPANFFSIVDGSSIQPQNNPNPGNVNDPEINKGIAELKGEQNLDKVTGRWADLDRKLVERAWLAPVGHRRLTTFLSERMDPECARFHPLYQNDYTAFCLK